MRDRSEKEIAKRLGGRLTNASGAVNDDGDIRLGSDYIIEVKRRSNSKKIVLTRSVWEKLRKQSVLHIKTPVYMFDNGTKKYVIFYSCDLNQLLGCYTTAGYIDETDNKDIRLSVKDMDAIHSQNIDGLLFSKWDMGFVCMEFENFSEKLVRRADEGRA